MPAAAAASATFTPPLTPLRLHARIFLARARLKIPGADYVPIASRMQKRVLQKRVAIAERASELRCSAHGPKVSHLSPEPGPGQRSALDPAHTHCPPLIYHHCASWQVIFLCRRHQALFYAQRQHPGKILTASSLTRAAGARCSQVQQ